MKKALLIALVLALAATACDRGGSIGDAAVPTPTWPQPTPPFATGRALLAGDDGSTLIDIEIAETPEQRQQGLMYRTEIPEDWGMAFVFFEESSGGFWMKNTLVSLSIAFFDAEGEIVRILDMEPCEEDPCPTYDSGASYSGALEVAQGSFAEWGIEEGDSIRILHDERH